MTSFSFSYSPPPNDRSPETHEDLWCFATVDIVSGPGGTAVLRNTTNDQRMIVSDEVAQALTLCSKFKTLSAHVAHVESRISPLRGQKEAITAALQTVIDRGLMVSARQRIAQLSAEAPSDALAPVRLFIITCDRPAQLDRLVHSLSSRPLPESVEGLWIIDDSRDPAASAANYAICQRAELSIPVIHFDHRQRTRLTTHLKRQVPEAVHAIAFSLERDQWGEAPTYGQARNLAQLLGVGRRCIVFDDDTLCEAVDPPFAPQGLRFGDIGQRDARLYSSPEVLASHKLSREESPITLMAERLGSNLSTLLRSEQSTTDAGLLSGVDGNSVARFTPTSIVTLMQTGFWGDPGTAQGNWIFFLPEKTVKRIVEDSSPLETLIAARSSWTGFKGDTITPYGSMSAMTGIDNTQLLPPYLPVSRVEDILFAVILQRIHPANMTLNTGWSVVHAPAEARDQRAELTTINSAPGLGNLVDWLGREPKDQWGLPPEMLLANVAEQIERLSAMSEHELNKLLNAELLSKQSQLLLRNSDHLTTCKAIPASKNLEMWQTFLVANREALGQAIQVPNPHAIASLSEPVGGLQALRSLAHNFAQSLKHWPKLRAAAATFSVEP